MIIDTTYLLPLAGISIDTDLLESIARGRVSLRFEELAVSLISVFELQAKATKLMVPAKFITKAVEAILASFRVEPFYKSEVVEVSYELRKLIPDYVDCVIVATAVTLKEGLVTEDSLILANAEAIERKYGVKVMSFKDLVK